jgi:hypothetical protein
MILSVHPRLNGPSENCVGRQPSYVDVGPIHIRVGTSTIASSARRGKSSNTGHIY